MNPAIAEIDWSHALASDPGISVAIVSRDGEVIFANPGAFSLFGADDQAPVEGKHLNELFHPEFARERMEWITSVAEWRKTLRVRHIYQGRDIVSTMIPLASPAGRSHVLVVSRSATPNDPASSVEEVETEFIDLGRLASLSNRELEVLVLLGHGRNVPETARMLYRSPRTIERHKEEIGRKLGASTIAEIVKIVNTVGLTVDHLDLKRLEALNPELKPSDEAEFNDVQAAQ